jgi:hypothetical protein
MWFLLVQLNDKKNEKIVKYLFVLFNQLMFLMDLLLALFRDRHSSFLEENLKFQYTFFVQVSSI